MFLDAAKRVEESAAATAAGSCGVRESYAEWKDWSPSEISHHGGTCCEIAREWLTSTDFSMLSGDGILTGPRWLRRRFKWGASSFPIHWCEAVRRERLDCGAFAAMACEAFTARGLRSLRAQIVQRFSEAAAGQWTQGWAERGQARQGWIDGELIYHEGCAIDVGGNRLKLWDPSAGWWVDPVQGNGYGSVLAVRFVAGRHRIDGNLRWGEHLVAPDEWHELR